MVYLVYGNMLMSLLNSLTWKKEHINQQNGCVRESENGPFKLVYYGSVIWFEGIAIEIALHSLSFHKSESKQPFTDWHSLACALMLSRFSHLKFSRLNAISDCAPFQTMAHSDCMAIGRNERKHVSQINIIG